LGPELSESVTVAWLLVSRFPNLSVTRTTKEELIGLPAMTLAGTCVKASFVAVLGVTVIPLEIVESNPALAFSV
jgi:hypothetical protein